MKIYDLHSHTTASDGQLSPTALVQRAVQQQVDALAITDHDSTEGWLEASEAVQKQKLPLQLVTGVEITCQWQQREIHLVGLRFAVNHPSLQSLLSQQRQYRYQRAQVIADYLAQQHGIMGIWQSLQHVNAKATALTRSHIANLLIQKHYGHYPAQVFQRYLIDATRAVGELAWCSLEQAIQQIQQAGGQAVLAHPDRYALKEPQFLELLNEFQAAGGQALEVAYSRQTTPQRQRLSLYAQRYQLLASAGSDFHYPGGVNELGRNLLLPSSSRAIWLSWGKQQRVMNKSVEQQYSL
ncbi:MAG: PHP domain-containing protein [Candidatus Symbiodolus clandestinus]